MAPTGAFKRQAPTDKGFRRLKGWRRSHDRLCPPLKADLDAIVSLRIPADLEKEQATLALIERRTAHFFGTLLINREGGPNQGRVRNALDGALEPFPLAFPGLKKGAELFRGIADGLSVAPIGQDEILISRSIALQQFWRQKTNGIITPDTGLFLELLREFFKLLEGFPEVMLFHARIPRAS